MQAQQVINIGFGNFVLAGRVVAIVSPASAPMKRLREDARDAGRLVDATQGRKTRSILVTDSNHIVLTAIHPETISQRFGQEGGEKSWKEPA
jgi:regulator of extracellular matrix RemA (YlzA/DUF370 family)